MVYDSARGVSVLFSGYGAPADTWTWNGSDWTQAAPTSSPAARHSYSLAFDAGRGRVVMHGGIRGGLTAETDTWEFDGALSNYGGEAPIDDKMTATATIAISGKITRTAA